MKGVSVWERFFLVFFSRLFGFYTKVRRESLFKNNNGKI